MSVAPVVGILTRGSCTEKQKTVHLKCCALCRLSRKWHSEQRSTDYQAVGGFVLGMLGLWDPGGSRKLQTHHVASVVAEAKTGRDIVRLP